MDIDELKASLAEAAPPAGLDLALNAMWWDRKGAWEKAHACAQEDESDSRTAWTHAYLHRKEGDLGNAAYWYRRAGQPVERGSLDAEWDAIATALLANR